MKLVCNIRHTPLHSFCHIRRLQFLCWVFEHPKSMRRKWIEICKVLFTLFLQTFYVKLPIGFPVTNCTPITSLNIFDRWVTMFLYNWYKNDRNLFLYKICKYCIKCMKFVLNFQNMHKEWQEFILMQFPTSFVMHHVKMDL